MSDRRGTAKFSAKFANTCILFVYKAAVNEHVAHGHLLHNSNLGATLVVFLSPIRLILVYKATSSN